MRKNNKGYSLVEMIVVISIIVVLAGLSMVTFNMANRKRPEKVRNNLEYYAEYAKNLSKAEDKDSCMVILMADDGCYYAIQGRASGDAQADLLASFKAKSSSGAYDLDISALKSTPDRAYNYNNMGRLVKIFHSDNKNAAETAATEITAANPLIIKFKKFDGSVITGSGVFYFSKYRSDTIQTHIKLEKSTGVFHQ